VVDGGQCRRLASSTYITAARKNSRVEYDESIFAPCPIRLCAFTISKLRAIKLGEEAPLLCPSPELGEVLVLPYVSVDSPNTVFSTYCIICIEVRRIRMVDAGIPQL
jgi:hypothetical protein